MGSQRVGHDLVTGKTKNKKKKQPFKTEEIQSKIQSGCPTGS